MSDFDRNYATSRGYAGDRAVAIDAGLRAYMIRVYNYMAGGVALTGIAAWLTYSYAMANPAFAASLGGISLVLMLASFGLVMFISFRISHLEASTARLLFFVYAGLIGVALSTLFLAYTATSITRVFFITAASFGALSLYGYTTKRDLSAMGSFLFMGLIGLIIASVVNIFLASTALQFALSVVGVGVFAGLTAWDTQSIKEMYNAYDDGTVVGRKAVMGALRLYLDFLNLFLSLLQLMGDRR
jgi:FtsH-binding integral membrane protein